MRPLESSIERKVAAWWDSRFPSPASRLKLEARGRAGWPDQMYMIPGGKPFFIEFKRKGELPRPLQSYIHSQMRENGYDVEVHDDADTAIAALRRRLG